MRVSKQTLSRGLSQWKSKCKNVKNYSSLKVESADGNLPECLNLADLTHTLKHVYSKAVH